MAFKYRWSILGSIICSAFVAVFWGANLGTVYPFVEIVLHNKSLHDWTDENIAEIENEITVRETKISDLRQQFEQNETDASLKSQIGIENSEVRMYQRKLGWAEYFQPIIKKYAPNEPFDTLKLIVIFMLIGTLIRCVFLAGNMYLVSRIGHRTILDLQNDVFNNVLNMEMSEIGVKGTGDLINRIRGETNAIGNSIQVLFGKTVREPMKMAACLAGAAFVNWRLLLFSLIVCPVALFVMVLLARQTKRANRKALEESANLLNRLYQALTYLRMVRASNMQADEAKRFKDVARDVYKKGMRISLLGALSRSNNEILSVTVMGLSVLAGGYLVLNQQTHLFFLRLSSTPMDFGQVILFFAFLIGAVDPLRKLSDVYNRLQCGVVAADRVFPIIDQQPKISDPTNPITIQGDQREIEFRNVTYSYEPDRPVLNDISFKLPSGSSVAIIGHNGCGKSTLINLLPRFFDPDSGQVLINGVDVKDMSLNAIRDQIGFVTQLTMLFGDSIYSNISYGIESATQEDVVAASKKAHADEFISQLDDGYHSLIQEHGNNLSGGQKQRLSLARAILKDPEILILDEATSQIDPESEQLIHDAIRNFVKDRTTLIVTHRMSTIELVDYILVMSEGQVVDFGSHDELMMRCEAYQRLRNMEIKDRAA